MSETEKHEKWVNVPVGVSESCAYTECTRDINPKSLPEDACDRGDGHCFVSKCFSARWLVWFGFGREKSENGGRQQPNIVK